MCSDTRAARGRLRVTDDHGAVFEHRGDLRAVLCTTVLVPEASEHNGVLVCSVPHVSSHESTDLLVIGSGGTGRTAALSSLEAAWRVMVLAKMPTAGRSTQVAGKIEERYGIATDEAERQLAAWEQQATEAWFVKQGTSNPGTQLHLTCHITVQRHARATGFQSDSKSRLRPHAAITGLRNTASKATASSRLVH
jgi:hypothetical protein